MSLLRLSSARPPSLLTRRFSTFPPHRLTIPYTPTCPTPTCACAPSPAGLDIDRTSPLLNTMAAYAEQVVLCTGESDWSSRIEDEPGATGEFVRGVKRVVGKGGSAFDPFTNILLTASSLPESEVPDTTTALLFPSFLTIPHIPHTPAAFVHLGAAYLAPKSLHAFHDSLSAAQKTALLRDEARAMHLPKPLPVTSPVILICGHGGRDARCGALGPVLQGAFEDVLQRGGIAGQVAQISHVGGHKFAGNVIVYVPPEWRGRSGETSMLAGMGIWYGRVGVREVEGVVEETLGRGRVVGELLRGGVVRGGGDVGRVVEEQIRRESGGGDGELRLRPRARR